MPAATRGSTGVKRSLAQFARDKKKIGCKVCTLPPDVRGQLGYKATKSKIDRTTQLEWLKSEFGVTLTNEDLTAHFGGHHDIP